MLPGKQDQIVNYNQSMWRSSANFEVYWNSEQYILYKEGKWLFIKQPNVFKKKNTINAIHDLHSSR